MDTVDDGDALRKLVSLICSPSPPADGAGKIALTSLFGGRYHARHLNSAGIRDALGLSGEDGVPFAGLINSDNPSSGPYGGASVVWFPQESAGALIGLVTGTRGLSPDEGILTRPGHRRRVAALRRFLSRAGVEAWSKSDPSAIGLELPQDVRKRFSEFERVFGRYGREMYCMAPVPEDGAIATKVIGAFFDLYAYERGWKPLKPYEAQFQSFEEDLRAMLFAEVTPNAVNDLLRRRRFVILQGAPGTGKTLMTEEIKTQYFAERGMTVQFHPAVTYEDFVIGLSPDPTEDGLRFRIRPGWFLEAAREAKDHPFLLVIDEVNRADLGKVLGEAIYLFEPIEIGSKNARKIRLPHPFDGHTEFSFPKNLYILATMNSADRSIAAMDLAVRRRFAFVNVSPNSTFVASLGLKLATDIFGRLMDVFVEHAPDDALVLMPGQSYFIAKNEDELFQRLRYELLPLLDEYLRQQLLGSAGSELLAVRDLIEDHVDANR